jgi:hypothetical protein
MDAGLLILGPGILIVIGIIVVYMWMGRSGRNGS